MEEKNEVQQITQDMVDWVLDDVSESGKLDSNQIAVFEQVLHATLQSLLTQTAFAPLVTCLSDDVYQGECAQALLDSLNLIDLTDIPRVRVRIRKKVHSWNSEEHSTGSLDSNLGHSSTEAQHHSKPRSSSPQQTNAVTKNATPEPSTYSSLKKKGHLVKKGHLKAIHKGEYTQSKQSIAEGSFGAVYRGTWNGVEVAIKQLKTGQRANVLLKELKREALILAKLSSPYVVHLHGVCFQYPYRMILEYCAGGSLFQLLHSTQPMSWDYRWQVGRDIAEGLAYIHARGIIHADLAARNILLTHDGRAKLADFGLSEVKSYIQFSAVSQQYVQPKKDRVATWEWSAPEVLQGEVFTKASDMYSFGTVLWELSSRELPYRATCQNAHQRLRVQAAVEVGECTPMSYRDSQNQEAGTVPPKMPSVWVQLMKACWSLKPDRRPSAVEALAQLTIGQLQGWGLSGSYSQNAHADDALAQLQNHQQQLQSDNVQLQQYVATYQQQSQQWQSQVSALQTLHEASQQQCVQLQYDLEQRQMAYQHLQAQFTQMRQQSQADVQRLTEALTELQQTIATQKTKLERYKVKKQELRAALSTTEMELKNQTAINQLLVQAPSNAQTSLKKHDKPVKPLKPSLNHVRSADTCQDSDSGSNQTLPSEGQAAAHVAKVSKQTWGEFESKLTQGWLGFFVKSVSQAHSELLKYVVEGHLEEVEQRLKANSKLALCQGDVTDLSGRTFKQITAFQYAAWALDVDMWEVILKYLDSQEAAHQLNALEQDRTDISEAYGTHYCLDDLISKYETYIKNYKKWDYDQRKTCWCQELGGAQRQCPAWYIYAMCEPGDDVAWVKGDMSLGFKRVYDMERGVKWWMTKKYEEGALGATWGAGRGRGRNVVMCCASSWKILSNGPVFVQPPYDSIDYTCTRQLKKQVGHQLDMLKKQLNVNANRSDVRRPGK